MSAGYRCQLSLLDFKLLEFKYSADHSSLLTLREYLGIVWIA